MIIAISLFVVYIISLVSLALNKGNCLQNLAGVTFSITILPIVLEISDVNMMINVHVSGLVFSFVLGYAINLVKPR
jgi:hypothetical protein